MRMRVVLIAVIVLAALTSAPAAHAAPPSNDAFASAKTIAPFPFYDELSVAEATTEAGEPTPTCLGGSSIGHTLWYTYTPSVDIAVKANSYNSDFDTVIALYKQTGSGFGGLVQLACNNNIQPAETVSRVAWNLVAGKQYYFQVGGVGAANGTLKFRVKQRLFKVGLVRGNEWFLNNDFDGTAERFFTYGRATDQQLTGDWVGAGVSLPWVRRGNAFYANRWLDGTPELIFSYGSATDTALLGDFNGDGILTPVVVRGNVWYFNNDFDGGAEFSLSFGRPTDVKLIGDWNGDGVYTPGVLRGNTWYLSNGFNGVADIVFSFGRSGDRPVVGDWDGNGTFTPGVVRGNVWYLNNGFDSTADVGFAFGRSTDRPIIGDWNGSTE